MDWRPFRRLVVFACIAVLLAVVLSPATHAQNDATQSQIDEAVDQALSDRGKINLGAPPKYPYLFHTFWFEKGDWAWGMGLDFNYNNTIPVSDDLNSLRDETSFDEIEYRFGARLDKWLDLYVSADFGSNATGGPADPEGDVRWAIMDMHGLPIPGFSNLRVGQQIMPVTLDNWTSPQNGSFIHKSYIGALANPYHQGLTFWDFNLKGSPKLVYSLALAKQSQGPNAPGNLLAASDADGNDDIDVIGQLGWYPWFRGPGDMLYTEISGGLYKPDDGRHNFGMPGIGNGVTGSVPAIGALPAEEYTATYLSGRYSNQSFSVWGDYGIIDADNCRTTGGPAFANCTTSSAEADAWHLTASYFLTGEVKPWGAPVGVNARAKPNKPYNPIKTSKGVEGYGYGGLELKARMQEIDMSEFGGLAPAAAAPRVSVASERSNWAIGLNWYITENLIFMTEYEHEELDDQDLVGATPSGVEQDVFNTQLNLRL